MGDHRPIVSLPALQLVDSIMTRQRMTFYEQNTCRIVNEKSQ